MMEFLIYNFFMIIYIFKNKMLKSKIYFINFMLLIFTFKFIFQINFSKMFMFPMNIYMNFMFMEYTEILLILSFWIIILMIYSIKLNSYKMNFFMILMLTLILNMYLYFSSGSLIMLYLMFELSMLPMFLLILGWGYSSERLEASLYMLFYTMFFSLPPLYIILKIYYEFYSLSFKEMIFLNISIHYLYNLMLMMMFLVKMPMYIIHMWLPKAHVEAPLIGSMFLAGVMLKMGGFGLLRIFKINFNDMKDLMFMFLILSLVGMLQVSLQCLIQYDLKLLVALSSVVHMGMVIGGIFMMTLTGWMGSMVMMIAHGLCSSGMFYMVNLNYEMLGSRSMLLEKGMLKFSPSMSLYWFLVFTCNMSIPLSLNLVGEVLILMSLVVWCKFLMVILFLVMFFSACYTLYMFSYSQHGYGYFMKINLIVKDFMKEYFVLILHLIPLFTLMFKMMSFM